MNSKDFFINNSITIYPSKSHGSITIPASKSILHRAIICASLAKGVSTLENVYISDDIMHTIDCFRKLGANIEINEDKLIIDGIKDFNSVNDTTLYVGGSASTLRFLIPILTLFNKEFKIYCNESLYNRPFSVYEELFKNNNGTFELNEEVVNDEAKYFITLSGKLKKTKYVIDGSISSQFISGMLLTLPLLNFDTQLITENVTSKGYIFLTLDIMNMFGITIPYSNEFNIHGNNCYKPFDYVIEGDYTQFANFVVLGTINNDISVNGIDINTLQSDAMLLNTFNNVRYTDYDEFYIKKENLNYLSFDLKDNPDLGPILCSLLTQTGGKLSNIERLKYKESNRIESMIEELKKFNVNIRLINNNLFIDKIDRLETDQVLNSHNDHRIFMALAILATISQSPITITGVDSINKSYPTFILDLKKLGVDIR